MSLNSSGSNHTFDGAVILNGKLQVSVVGTAVSYEVTETDYYDWGLGSVYIREQSKCHDNELFLGCVEGRIGHSVCPLLWDFPFHLSFLNLENTHSCS